ncbi:MAG: Uma2 family endonuclease [Clostridia bacterium]|nr:Uma2 family endonuclease [Clostridia bacterium]
MPALVVEVHDPSEPDLAKKIHQCIEAGVRAVWVVDPKTRTLTRHAPGEEPRTWSDPESVVEEPVLPGFSCRLEELFGEE